MSDGQIQKEVVQVQVDVATRNAQSAVDSVAKLRQELVTRLQHLERLVQTQNSTIIELQTKYNLLLSKRFDHGRTEDG